MLCWPSAERAGPVCRRMDGENLVPDLFPAKPLREIPKATHHTENAVDKIVTGFRHTTSERDVPDRPQSQDKRAAEGNLRASASDARSSARGLRLPLPLLVADLGRFRIHLTSCIAFDTDSCTRALPAGFLDLGAILRLNPIVEYADATFQNVTVAAQIEISAYRQIGYAFSRDASIRRRTVAIVLPFAIDIAILYDVIDAAPSWGAFADALAVEASLTERALGDG